MKKRERGQILPMVMICLVLMAVIISGLVNWIQNDTTASVKQQKSASAINFAEAGIDRGTWKLQSSTDTFVQAVTGTTIGGYNFDVTYRDIPGGTYRIKFSVGGPRSVTVVAEGRDGMNRETRAISATFKNQTIYSALMSGGKVTWAKGLGIFWGPIIAQGDIQLMDDVVAAWYYPRKYTKGVVTGTAANPRDTNGLAPPNTDNVEWWSQYAGVPNVPVLDFVALRSSAAATGTLNIYGCKNSANHGINNSIAGPAPWDLNSPCGTVAASHATHFGNSTNYVKTVLLDPTFSKDYVWYWDNDLVLTGEFCGSSPCSPTGHSTSLRGTVIVVGNLIIDTPGDFVYTGHVPAGAYQEQNKLTIAGYDTAAANEYPGDMGLHTSATTYAFGTAPACIPITGCGGIATVGVRGLTYVGKDLTITSYMDFHGALWVNGSVTASGGSASQFCGIFYDDTLTVPALNVILLRQSWAEVPASAAVWP